MNKLNIKQEKGSITLFVVIAMMFFLMIVVGIYMQSQNKLQAQYSEIDAIKTNYEMLSGIGNEDNIYNQLYEVENNNI